MDRETAKLTSLFFDAMIKIAEEDKIEISSSLVAYSTVHMLSMMGEEDPDLIPQIIKMLEQVDG